MYHILFSFFIHFLADGLASEDWGKEEYQYQYTIKKKNPQKQNTSNTFSDLKASPTLKNIINIFIILIFLYIT